MTVEKVLVKDSEGTFEEKLVCFPGKVPDELLCVVCKNISSKQFKDSQGHIYCEPCICMLESDGTIQWEIGDTRFTTYVNQLSQCNSAYSRALQLTARCPKEGCTFEAALKDLFNHYRRCQPSGITNKPCPLCYTEMHPRLLPEHISTQCDQRLLSCPYCTDEHTASSLEDHLDNCDHRPATCEHCEEDFDTFFELRDQHLDVCSRRQEKCPYEKLGCNFQGVAVDVQKHVSCCSDARLLMETIATLSTKVEQLTEDNKRLENRLQHLEDKQKEEAFSRLNTEAATEELSGEVNDLKKRLAAQRKEPEVERRLARLEEVNAVYKEPFEQLVQNIAHLN